MLATHVVNDHIAVQNRVRGEQDDRTATGRRERRRAAMIAAARELFFERGYDAVTLGEIVRRSGGSLTTLYALFTNKEGLLRAIVAEERFEGIERLDAIVARGESAAATLAAIAESIQRAIGQPDVLQLMRVVIAKSLVDAEFARAIYENAHRPRLEWLTALFAQWTEAGQARIAEPEVAAHFFLALTLHGTQTHALYGMKPDERIADRSAEDAVALFVAGYAIGGETAAP